MRVQFVGLAASLVLCGSFASSDEPTEPSTGFRDDFTEKQNHTWEILNPNPDMISFHKRPEMLTITTERGGIWNYYDTAKNIFLIKTPPLQNYIVTTRIVGFDPKEKYQQAGLICFNDIDNYVKLVYEFDPGNGGQSIAVVPELAGKDQPNSYVKVSEAIDELWLRIIVYEGTMAFAASRDGITYRNIAIQKSEFEAPSQLGLIAKNGIPMATKGIDASFDFFEVVSLDSKPDVKAELLKALEF